MCLHGSSHELSLPADLTFSLDRHARLGSCPRHLDRRCCSEFFGFQDDRVVIDVVVVGWTRSLAAAVAVSALA